MLGVPAARGAQRGSSWAESWRQPIDVARLRCRALARPCAGRCTVAPTLVPHASPEHGHRLELGPRAELGAQRLDVAAHRPAGDPDHRADLGHPVSRRRAGRGRVAAAVSAAASGSRGAVLLDSAAPRRRDSADRPRGVHHESPCEEALHHLGQLGRPTTPGSRRRPRSPCEQPPHTTRPRARGDDHDADPAHRDEPGELVDHVGPSAPSRIATTRRARAAGVTPATASLAHPVSHESARARRQPAERRAAATAWATRRCGETTQRASPVPGDARHARRGADAPSPLLERIRVDTTAAASEHRRRGGATCTELGTADTGVRARGPRRPSRRPALRLPQVVIARSPCQQSSAVLDEDC